MICREEPPWSLQTPAAFAPPYALLSLLLFVYARRDKWKGKWKFHGDSFRLMVLLIRANLSHQAPPSVGKIQDFTIAGIYFLKSQHFGHSLCIMSLCDKSNNSQNSGQQNSIIFLHKMQMFVDVRKFISN